MDKNDICQVILKVKGHHLVDDREIEIGEILIKRTQEEIFDKFDKYSCIKNDKWYLDFKKEKLKNDKN
jgi:hypothetical protein